MTFQKLSVLATLAALLSTCPKGRQMYGTYTHRTNFQSSPFPIILLKNEALLYRSILEEASFYSATGNTVTRISQKQSLYGKPSTNFFIGNTKQRLK